MDMRWLEKRHQTWYAVLDVPRPLRAILGKRRFVKSLKTRDIVVARARRHAAIVEFQRMLKAPPRAAGDPWVARGLVWQDEITKAGEDDTVYLAFHEDLDRIAEGKGVRAAQSMHGAATGTRTPLLTYLEPWLMEGGRKGPLRDSSKAAYRGAIEQLARYKPSIQDFTKQTVSAWVIDQLSMGRNRKTINRVVATGKAYWAWLVRRNILTTNPWTGQAVGLDGQQHKRAFTDAEVATLIAKAPK